MKISIYLIFILLMFGVAQAALSDNLVSYYSFDSDAITDDHSTNDGTSTGANHNTTNTKLGAGSTFYQGDGDRIGFPTGISSLPITINAWVDPDSTSGNNYFIGLDKGSLWPYSGFATGSTSYVRAQSNTASSSGTTYTTGWQMFTLKIVNNSHTELLRNGQSIANYTSSVSFSSSYNEVLLGTLSQALVTDSFEGHIDELSFYDADLSQSDVEELYSSGSGCDYDCITVLPSTISVLPVLNITFDNSADPFDDYSQYDYNFTVGGQLNYINRTYAKWYGGGNMSYQGDSDLELLNAQWADMKGMSTCWWMKPDRASTGDTMGYFSLSSGGADVGTLKAYDEGYGLTLDFHFVNGTNIKESTTGSKVEANTWVHLCTQYDQEAGTVQTWKNGVLTMNETVGSGDIDYAVNDNFYIGSWQFDIRDINGYIDEFLFWNSSVLTTDYVYNLYDSQRLGTPPDYDLYIKKISYELPIDWSNPRNELALGGTMAINVTFGNGGIGVANSSVYNISLNDVELCTGSVSLGAVSEQTVTCNWNTSVGWHAGTVTIDTTNTNNEDFEDNNEQTLIIPFINRPWFAFNLTDWNNTIVPQANDYEVSKDDYEWLNYGGCSAFNDGYDGDDVDPYGKYARTCAMSCLRNGYTGYGCSAAMIHLEGWTNRSISSYSKTQNVHETGHLGVAYDLMFPIMTQAQAYDWADGLEDIAQQVANIPGIRPDQDNPDLIAGDNGQGFSSGFATLVYSILGAEYDNPTVIHEFVDDYSGGNLAEEWRNRERRFIRSWKNDSTALYEEGNSYLWYSMYHHIDNSIFHKRFGLLNITEYQTAYNAIAFEILSQSLDFNYNGDNIRNDRNQYQRFIQRGDSRSYGHPSDGSILNRAVFTLAGIASDDENIKKGIIWLRNMSNYVGDGDVVDGFADAYLFPLLVSQTDGNLWSSIDDNLDQYFYDGANDIYQLRNGYTYSNDTLLQVDGGEERMNGHSVASGYYLYALGEPFIDYQQVPYNDDTRSENWVAGISLQNDTQTNEGQTSFYNSDCYSAELNQYYGMSTCPAAYYTLDWPDYRRLPESVGGDLFDYFGSQDDFVGGVASWRPYYNTDNVTEFWLVYDDVVLKRSIVTGNVQGEGVYHNFISLSPEFSLISSNSENWTLQRTGTDKYLETRLIDSDAAISLQGGVTALNACLKKGSCIGADTTNQTYRRIYYYSASDDIDFTFYHHWYENSDTKIISEIISGDDDKGVNIDSSVYLLLDGDGDGVDYGGFFTDGWSLMVNDTHLATNGATFIGNLTDNFTLPYTPYSGLILNNGAVINDTPEDPEGDVTPPVISGVSAGSIGISSARAVFSTDEAANVTLTYTDGVDDNGTVTQTSYTTSHSLLMSGLSSNTSYNFSLVSVCDASGNCASSYAHPFSTLEPSVSLERSVTSNLLPFIVILMALSIISFIYVFFNDKAVNDPFNVAMMIVAALVALICLVIMAITIGGLS